MIFKITADKKYIEVECTGEKGASFDDFKSKLPAGDCRYGVLDVEINTKSGATTNKLIFISWCPRPHARTLACPHTHAHIHRQTQTHARTHAHTHARTHRPNAQPVI